MRLITYSPIIVSKDLKEKCNKIKGKDIEEGILLSSFAYLTRKEGILRKKVTDYVLKGSYSSHENLLTNLKKELIDIWPWLSEIKIPDIEIESAQKRRVIYFDIKREELVKDTFAYVFIGEVEMGNLDLKEEKLIKLSNACRSFTEALATLEWKATYETIPSLSDFYEKLKSKWVKEVKFPLRIGYWTDDPYLGWLISFWRVKEIREHLKKKLRKDPYPEKILYSPKERTTFGWAYLVS